MRRIILVLGVLLFCAPAWAEVSFGGGDGSSLAQAVVVIGARTDHEGVVSEYAWLDHYYPGYERDSQALLENAGRLYDELTIRQNGKTFKVYFEITDFFGKM